MPVNTSNSYGKITITEEAIGSVCGKVALDCYGVVDLVAKKFSDNLHELFRKKSNNKGVKVSHSNIKTNKHYNANVQKVRVDVDGQTKSEYVCTKCLKTLKD